VQWLVTGKTQGGLRHQADRNLFGREEALRAYSAAGAWISNEEDRKGTLSVGKLADLAVLAEDYFSVPEHRISQMSSVLTVVGGKVAYGEGKYAALGPPPPKPAQDWLPVNRYPGYAKLAQVELQAQFASAESPELPPVVVGADGIQWTIGCGCAAG
jgi:hypothetical protein